MAQGRIVLASDVGGHKELIRDGDNGNLFRAGDPESLMNAILMILQRHNEWPRMQLSGRQFVERERSWPASVARYRTVYAGLV